MAFVDDPNQNSEAPVAGPAPLSQSAAPMAEQQAPENTSQQAASGLSGSSQPESQPKGINKGRTATKASSGMFNNINKYVEKNKPQAQKMATQSLQNVKKAGDDIKEQQKKSIDQFTTLAQSGGLQNTQEQVQRLSDFTTQQSGLNQEQESDLTDDQFSDIINAKYQGPMNLVDTGDIYTGLSKQAEKASRIGNLAQSTEGIEQLLRDDFTRGGRQYTKGSSKLDNLLMGQQTDAMAQMQDLGSQIDSKENILKNVANQARQVAGQTSSDIDATRRQSRDVFSNLASERKQQVDNRIKDVIDNWDNLPAHFRNAMSNPDGTVNLSALEASTLGVQSGEGLYNLSGSDLFGTAEDPIVAAERARLISSGEQGNLDRINALSRLAEKGEGLFDIGEYFDSDKAGTQSALDALSLQGVRDKLTSAEKGFRKDAARNQVGVGKGSSRYNAGWGRRKKVSRSSRQDANLRDILASQGYDFDSDIQTKDTSNMDYIKNLSNIAKGRVEGQEGFDITDMNDLLGGGLVNMGTVGLSDQLNTAKDAIWDNANNPLLNMATLGLGGGLGNLGSSIFGGGKSKAKRQAQAEAVRNATKDLQSKLGTQLNQSGFRNRIGVSDNEQTQKRDADLMELLRKLDTTNKQK